MTDASHDKRISIRIGGTNSRPYKSIDALEWDDIPPFVVLTGLNGSGKSQLLEVLAYRIPRVSNPSNPSLNTVVAEVTGDAFAADEVAYLPATGMFTPHSVSGTQEIRSITQNLDNPNPQNLSDHARRARIERHLKKLGLNRNQLSPEEVLKRLPEDLSFLIDDVDAISGLAHVFWNYRLRSLVELEQRTPDSDIQKKLGPPPWDVINESLKVAEFPYRLKSPIGLSVFSQYRLQLVESMSGQDLTLEPGDLSSGEKVLFQLVSWLYNSTHHNRFPRLFLLDEPDAHLHPSLTRQFMEVIKQVLVDRYGVRVILSTHSPSTVALAPPDSLYEMWRVAPRIRKSKSAEETIGLLTSGLLIVSRFTRYVLVEGKTDVEFYDLIRDILTEQGPNRDLRALLPSASLVFLPASVGDRKEEIGGGKNVVRQWIEKLNEAPLSQLFRGIIDKDADNTATDRVLVVGRHSIENYLLDPFIVFGVLIEEGAAPTLSGVKLTAGNEHLLRELPDTPLQSIVNYVQTTVEQHCSKVGKAPMGAELALRDVKFTNGKKVAYPSWMLDRRGHDLMGVYQATFGSRIIIRSKLEKMFRRVRLVPDELADLMNQLAS